MNFSKNNITKLTILYEERQTIYEEKYDYILKLIRRTIKDFIILCFVEEIISLGPYFSFFTTNCDKFYIKLIPLARFEFKEIKE